jgi:hypothetical protein
MWDSCSGDTGGLGKVRDHSIVKFRLRWNAECRFEFGQARRVGDVGLFDGNILGTEASGSGDVSKQGAHMTACRGD